MGSVSQGLAQRHEGDPLKPVIEFLDIRRTFVMGDQQVHAVDGVTLTVGEGEFVAIMGASGSGKSTLMNLLGCLDTPTGGRYRLAGREVSGLDDDALAEVRNAQIGFVFQTFNLLPRLTARQNVALPLAYARVSTGERAERADAMLQLVGLSDRAGHRPHQLSGGQRQRVAIARALIHRPSLILADEPTGNLDSTTSGEIMELFDQLHGQGNTIVTVTHDPDIGAHAQRIVRMRDGRIEEDVHHAA
jgi:putative ABC transport system ATP-binding protein